MSILYQKKHRIARISGLPVNNYHLYDYTYQKNHRSGYSDKHIVHTATEVKKQLFKDTPKLKAVIADLH